MKKGTLKQILLITDGHSNQGEDPVAMAAIAKEQGVAVNVIGVVSERTDKLSERGIAEIEAIAKAGGGVSEIVYAQQLAKTVQHVTKKAMTATIQGVVNKELQQILGEEYSVEQLSPEKRGEVIDVVEDLGETIDLQVLILVDTSASMESKLPVVQDALIDLSISLTSRSGENLFSLYAFPSRRKETECLLQWTPQLRSLKSVFQRLKPAGVTPTGPALRVATTELSGDFQDAQALASEMERFDETGI